MLKDKNTPKERESTTMTNTITLNNKTYNVNELTTEHFNTRYYDEEKGFDYTIEIETFYIVDYTQKNGVVCKDIKMNRLTYLANKALGTPMTVKEQWKEIIKHYIYD